MSGLKASVDLDDTDDTLIYTVPDSTWGTYTVSICPRAIDALVRLGVTTGGAPNSGSWIDYDEAIRERSGIVLSAGQRIYVRTDTADVSVNVWGIEEAA